MCAFPRPLKPTTATRTVLLGLCKALAFSAAGNATPALKKLLDDPDATLGIYYLDHGDHTKGAKAFRAATAKLPDDPTLRSLLKQCEQN